MEFIVPKGIPNDKYLVRVEGIALYQAQAPGGKLWPRQNWCSPENMLQCPAGGEMSNVSTGSATCTLYWPLPRQSGMFPAIGLVHLEGHNGPRDAESPGKPRTAQMIDLRARRDCPFFNVLRTSPVFIFPRFPVLI